MNNSSAMMIRDGKTYNNPLSEANMVMMGLEIPTPSCSTEANMILDGLEKNETKAIDLTDKRDCCMFL